MKNVHPEVLPHTLRLVLRALLLAWTALGLFGCKPEPKSLDEPMPNIAADQITFATNAPELTSLTVEPAQARKATTVGLYGRLAWDEDVTVRIHSPVAGRVLEIPVEANQTVAAGDALAALNSPDFSQALAEARTAAGNFAAAEKTFARVKDLFAHGAAAEKDVEAAEAADVSARAEKDRAAARLANYGGSEPSTNAAYLLRSPLAGVLVEKNITPGQEIRSDLMLANAPQFFTPLFVVTDPARLWVQLDVSENDLRRLKSGVPIIVRSQSRPGEEFHGRLDVVAESLDPTTHMVKVRGSVDNGARRLKAEMFVTVELAEAEAGQPEVSAKSVFLQGDRHFVFLEEQPGKFHRREIKVGEEHGGSVAVLDGLQPGERVVSRGALMLNQMLE